MVFILDWKRICWMSKTWDRDGPWRNMTRAYFWPAVSKRPFWLDPKRFIFYHKGRKLKILGFLGEIFQTQTQTKDGWPYPTRVKHFWPCPITNLGDWKFLTLANPSWKTDGWQQTHSPEYPGFWLVQWNQWWPFEKETEKNL